MAKKPPAPYEATPRSYEQDLGDGFHERVWGATVLASSRRKDSKGITIPLAVGDPVRIRTKGDTALGKEWLAKITKVLQDHGGRAMVLTNTEDLFEAAREERKAQRDSANVVSLPRSREV